MKYFEQNFEKYKDNWFHQVDKVENKDEAYIIDFECTSKIYYQFIQFGKKDSNGNREVKKIKDVPFCTFFRLDLKYVPDWDKF